MSRDLKVNNSISRDLILSFSARGYDQHIAK